MTCELHLQLLGAPHITLNGAPIRFRRRKALALLAYLAVTGRPHTRDSLATLLADATSDQLARQQLRNALHDLTLHLGDYLQITPQSLALPANAAITVDVAAFTAGINAAQATSDVERLEQAVNQYGGELLAGFNLRHAPDFEEWLLLERERLHSLLLAALQQLIAWRTRQGDLESAIAAARRLLALEPAHEQTHRQLIALLAQHGQPDRALAQYLACERILAAEFGLTPSPATQALYAQLLAPARTPPHNLPQPHFPLVGRRSELAWLHQQLVDPDCRVITLVGIGGSGKTSLALAAVARFVQANQPAPSMPFPDGIYLVDLAAISGQAATANPGAATVRQLVTAIAATLGLVLEGTADQPQQLKYALQNQRLLLLLDNAEDLVAGAAYLSELVASAPALKLLVTSRAPLHIQSERLLDLGGLPVPTTADELATTAASQLFLAHAQRVRPQLQLTPPEQAALIQLCQMVEGLPLALVLAAYWTRTLHIGELVAELRQSLNLFNTPLRDLPARQQSMRTVLAWTWRQLTPTCAAILRQASVFHDGCDAAAARAVLNAGQIQLSMLCDYGLMSRDLTGRYRLHALVRQYGAEQLAAHPAEAEQVHCRHAVYYAELAAGIALDQDPQRERIHRVGAEYADITAAWMWAVAAERWDLLRQLQPTLSAWLDIKGYFQTGCELFGCAAARMRQCPDKAAHPDERLLFLIELIHFHGRLGRFEQAHTVFQEAIVCVPCAADALHARLTYYCGLIEFYQGSPPSSIETERAALALAERANNQRLQVEILRALGHVALATANYAQASTWLHEALLRAQQLAMHRSSAVILTDLGDLAFWTLDYTIANRRYEESLHLSRELDDHAAIPRTLASLGRVAGDQGDFARATDYLTTGLEMARKIGNVFAEAISLQGLGVIAFQQGDCQSARPLLEESIKLMRLIGNKEGLARSLMQLAIVYNEIHEQQLGQALMNEALTLMRAVHNLRGLSGALNNMGLAALNHGDTIQAAALLEESLALTRTIGYVYGTAIALSNLGLLALQRGEVSLARANFSESAAIRLRIGAILSLAYSLVGLAATELAMPLAAACGEPLDPARQRQAAVQTVHWIGAADQLVSQLAIRLYDLYQTLLDQTRAQAQALLDSAAFAAAYAEGRATAPEALLQALE